MKDTEPFSFTYNSLRMRNSVVHNYPLKLKDGGSSSENYFKFYCICLENTTRIAKPNALFRQQPEHTVLIH